MVSPTALLDRSFGRRPKPLVSGLLSKDDLENAWGDQIAGSIEDLYLPFFRPVAMAMRENDQAKVVGARDTFEDGSLALYHALLQKEAFDNMVNNGLAPLFERLEKMLGDKKWYCSQNVSNSEFQSRMSSVPVFRCTGSICTSLSW